MRISLLLIVLVAACGGNPLTSSTPPLEHRATAAACSGTRPAGNCSGTTALPGGCSDDSQCTAGSQGRCFHYHNGTCSCTYDTCTSDAQCPKNQLCGCHGTFGIDATTADACIPGNCRTDSDCGPGGYCSPSLDFICGTYAGVTGFYCHTAQDTCVNDSDCKSANALPAFCGYNPEIGHWACSMTACAG
jgi:hypothetical protein